TTTTTTAAPWHVLSLRPGRHFKLPYSSSMSRPSIQRLSSASALSWTCRKCRLQSKPLRSQWRQPRPFSTTTHSLGDLHPETEVRAAPEIDFDKPELPKQVPARII